MGGEIEIKKEPLYLAEVKIIPDVSLSSEEPCQDTDYRNTV
jgi:hypothetical protein